MLCLCGHCKRMKPLRGSVVFVNSAGVSESKVDKLTHTEPVLVNTHPLTLGARR
jgi:hypothetical protein